MGTIKKQGGYFNVSLDSDNGTYFTPVGSTVAGRNVSGYLKTGKRDISLTRWNGSTMLSVPFSRFESSSRKYGTNDFGDTLTGIAFKLPAGRWIIGASMGEGMLFRGELLSDYETVAEALKLAEQCAEYWAQIDYDDFVADQEQQALDAIAEAEQAELDDLSRAAGFIC